MVPGLAWPGMPSANGQALLSLLYQIEENQWLPVSELIDRQRRQRKELFTAALRSVPFYRDQNCYHIDPDDPDAWSNLPVIPRPALQQEFELLLNHALPPAHGEATDYSTSGSTGRPVTVRISTLAKMVSAAFSIRGHLWHRRDLNGRLASIHIDRGNQAPYPDGVQQESWGWPTAELYKTGPASLLSINTPLDQQAEWLQRQNPHYLLSTPSNLLRLSEYCAKHELPLPALRDVSTVSEVVSDELREQIKEVWDVPVIDTYSTKETGSIAVQCPHGDHYHVMSEGVFLEVLNSQGLHCAPGETGRVVLTRLHNFAMPLIRYEIGDYAEVGEPCRCGRNQLVLKKILGRVRNMLVLPDGSFHWPSFRRRQFTNLIPVRQHQFVQTSSDIIEVRLVVDRPVTVAEEQQLSNLFNERLPFHFQFNFIYTDEIPRHSTGKFEDFYSEIA